jgi:hypothetical protein
MTLDVRLRPEAEDGLAEAAVWYEEQQPGLGQRSFNQLYLGGQNLRAVSSDNRQINAQNRQMSHRFGRLPRLSALALQVTCEEEGRRWY